MRRDPRPGSGRRVRYALQLAVAVVVAVVALPGVASADPGLQSAQPASGAVLDAMPGSVVLRFAERVSGADSHVGLSGPDGRDLTDGEAEQTGPSELRVPVRPAEAGDVTVAYHVIFLDGRSSTGAYRFSAGTGSAPAPLSVTAQREATASVEQHVHQIDTASAVLLVVDGAVLLAVVFLLWARPRGRVTARPWRYRDPDGLGP